ncbi:Ycf66 family protein [Leptolyngbyaceae cyanobacterium UHCC 1019]
MLAYILAFMIGSGSVALYMAAFFFPEVHRKNDFIWSGVGLFYGLVLWVCAERITGGVLLGQAASVTLLGWLGWQTFLLRRQVTPLDQQTPLPTADDVKASLTALTGSEGRAEAVGQASSVLNQVKQGVQGAVARVTALKRSPPESEIYVPPSLEEFGTAGQDAIARFAKAAIPEAEQKTVESLVDEATEAATDTLAESAQIVNKAIAPVPQPVIKPVTEPVIELMAETATESTKGLGGLFQGLNPKHQKKESKPVYVRKQFREENATAPVKTGKKPLSKESQRKENKPASKPVYVRKQFREEITPEPEKLVEAAIAEIKDIEIKNTEAKEPKSSNPATSGVDLSAAIASISETVSSETISEAVVSDLLGNAPVETSAAEIVEDLLEDIFAQEESLVIEPTEVIEVAIELSDAVIEPITWAAELEDNTAIDPMPSATDNSQHLHNSP